MPENNQQTPDRTADEDMDMNEQLTQELYRQQVVMQRVSGLDQYPGMLPVHAQHHLQHPSAHPMHPVHHMHMSQMYAAHSLMHTMPAFMASAAPPPPPALPGVDMSLQNADAWKQFHELGTEMIITKSGRRMFPSLRAAMSGLDATANYCVMIEMVPIGDCRFKYSGSQWLPAGGPEPQSNFRFYMHPDSPANGAHWMAQPVLFNKIKLTNNTLDDGGHCVLTSMHKYVPRIHVIQSNDPAEWSFSPQQSFCFRETEFIAVTAYQNDRITRLKIETNPFAKGFREQGQSRSKRKMQTSNDCLKRGRPTDADDEEIDVVAADDDAISADDQAAIDSTMSTAISPFSQQQPQHSSSSSSSFATHPHHQHLPFSSAAHMLPAAYAQAPTNDRYRQAMMQYISACMGNGAANLPAPFGAQMPPAMLPQQQQAPVPHHPIAQRAQPNGSVSPPNSPYSSSVSSTSSQRSSPVESLSASCSQPPHAYPLMDMHQQQHHHQLQHQSQQPHPLAGHSDYHYHPHALPNDAHQPIVSDSPPTSGSDGSPYSSQPASPAGSDQRSACSASPQSSSSPKAKAKCGFSISAILAKNE